MSALTTHLLQRIADNPRLAFYFDPLTRTMELLTEAHCADHALDLQAFRLTYFPQLRFERSLDRDEVLEALKAVRDYFWNPDCNPPVLRECDVQDLVEAAIAKAEGRQ